MTKKTTYASFRARLIAGFVLLVALLAALLFWKINSGYHAERAAAFSQTKSFAQAMSAHVASEMRSVDLSLIRSASVRKLFELTGRHGARASEAYCLLKLLGARQHCCPHRPHRPPVRYRPSQQDKQL